MFINGFLLLTACFAGFMACCASLWLARRFDRAERRHAYEMDCLVKSLQALEQQNLMLGDRLQAYAESQATLAKLETAQANRQALEGEADLIPQRPAGRLLH